jgi:tripartite-type tricarboxylate transporter receptor subunit TctC
MLTALSRIVIALAASMMLVAAAGAQGYPTRQITLIVPYAAGGPTDAIARLIGESMGNTLGQSIIIENALGAGGTTGAGRVAKSEPDGYTLLIHHLALAAGATLYPKLSYETTEAFAGIGLINSGPFVLNGKKSHPANNIKEALDYIRANQEKVTMGGAGAGSGSNLCNMLIQSMLGVKISEVSYRGTGPAMNDLVGGQIDFLCDQSTNAMSQIKGGTIKPYAVTSLERMNDLKDLPTMAEAGLPGFELVQWHALYVPKGTPAPVVATLSAALEKALVDPKVLARFDDFATILFPANARGPAATDARLKSEVALWAKVIKDAGAQAK